MFTRCPNGGARQPGPKKRGSLVPRNFVADHYGVTNPPPAAPPADLPTK
jgi:hypothetical protein